MNLEAQINYLKPSSSELMKKQFRLEHRLQNAEVDELKTDQKRLLSSCHFGVIKHSNNDKTDLMLPKTKAQLLSPPFLGVQNKQKREGKKKTVSFNRYLPIQSITESQSKSIIFSASTLQISQRIIEKTAQQMKFKPQTRTSYANNLLILANQKQKTGLNRYLSSKVTLQKQEEIPLLKISNFASDKKMGDANQHRDTFLPIPASQAKSRSVAKPDSTSSKNVKIPSFLKGKHSRKESLSIDENHQVKQFASQPSITEQNGINNQPNFEFQIYIKPAIKKRSIKDFLIVKTIGKGAFGNAYIAVQKHMGFICVLKTLQKGKIKEENTEETLIRQIKIQSYFQHKHLTTLYGFFDDELHIYLILQLLPGGNLKQNIKENTLSEQAAANIIYQLCCGVSYMHSRNIIHRDIKPENMFVFEDYIKLGDFGCAVDCQNNRTTFVGSPLYLSPQQLRKDEYDAKVDVWEIGTILYQLLFGVCPFMSDIAQIVRGNQDPRDLAQLQFPPEIPISRHAQDFMARALDKNSYTRMTIKSALRHIFLKQSKQEFDMSKNLQ